MLLFVGCFVYAERNVKISSFVKLRILKYIFCRCSVVYRYIHYEINSISLRKPNESLIRINKRTNVNRIEMCYFYIFKPNFFNFIDRMTSQGDTNKQRLAILQEEVANIVSQNDFSLMSNRVPFKRYVCQKLPMFQPPFPCLFLFRSN